jgi:glycine betaine/choline ABC-type transport system substrate-binding protein
VSRRSLGAIPLLLLGILAGCGRREDVIVVGSKNFTEQRILGELLAQTVEAAGLRAQRKFDLGGTFVCDAAIRAGQIDMYVEYTGTALAAILKEAPAGRDARQVYERVKEVYAKDGLVWMEPLGFDNTFALVVRGEDAQRLGVRTISDAVPYARGWKAGFGYEFKERADGYGGLAKTYGLQFADIKTMDLGLIYRALVDRQVDLVAGNATDGQIESLRLVVLADDKKYFPPYEAAVVARASTLNDRPALSEKLRHLAGTLSAQTMAKLNYAVDGQHMSPADVIRQTVP